MMKQNVFNFLKSYSYNELDINRLLVTSFLEYNHITDVTNEFINEFILESEEDQVQVDLFLSLFASEFDIELLLELFEFVISPQDKEINGAVFTPKYIREYIVDQVFINLDNNNVDFNLLTFVDIACGCGGFFCTISDMYRVRHEKTFYEIYRDNIYGLDIKEYSVVRSKIILILHAIMNGEDIEVFDFNLFVGNALDFDWNNIDIIRKNSGFDVVVGNPPYVGSTNLDIETKELARTWDVSSTGKLDLYIPFFEIGMKWLKTNGILGYITVSNFYRSLNGRALRGYFSKNSYSFKLVDFGSKQVFKSRLTYTCICIIQKTLGFLKYTNTIPSKIDCLKDKDFITFDYESLDDTEGWHLDDATTKLNLYRIENAGDKLGNLFSIRNGFATLRNKIYLFQPLYEDELFYYFKRDGMDIQIEKSICRDAIKPNILKKESDLDKFKEKIIFPYLVIDNNEEGLFHNQINRTAVLIDENYFIETYPYAYKYLYDRKMELSKRDKGNKIYENWYAYGRNQALNIQGLKLLFPYISDAPYFIYTDDLDLLFYNGYALVSNSKEDLMFIKKILKSDVFWYYIVKTSKPYSSNYFALAKNYIKNFSVPAFTTDERKYFMSLRSKRKINQFLIGKYNISDMSI